MTAKENLSWINYVRTICMLFVYFFHAENRAHFDFLNRIVDISFRPFFINVFFIISGYLIFRKQKQLLNDFPTFFSWFHSEGAKYLKNILFKLILPSILFAAFLFIPKMLVRDENIELCEFFRQTLGGYTMWFVSALAVSQLLLFIPLALRLVSIIGWLFYGSLLFCGAIFLHNVGLDNFPWYYQGGLCAVLFLAFGALWFSIENFSIIKKTWFLSGLCVVYFLVDYLFNAPINLTYMNVSLCGLFLSIIGSMMIIVVCKMLKPRKWVDYVGRSTIGLYFFSGAIPEVVSVIFKRFVDLNNVFFLLVVLISFLLAVLINRFLMNHVGFVFDIRMLFKRKK